MSLKYVSVIFYTYLQVQKYTEKLSVADNLGSGEFNDKF
jgi:hypothetical protein